jgi:hypothetical protein
MSQATDLLNRIRRQKEETAALKELYAELFPPEFMVADSQFGVWLRRYSFDIITESFDRTADWLNQCRQKVEEAEAAGEKPDPCYCKAKLDVVKYASGVMVKKSKEGGNG